MNRKRAVDFEDLPSNMGKFLDLGVLLVFKKLLIVLNAQKISGKWIESLGDSHTRPRDEKMRI